MVIMARKVNGIAQTQRGVRETMNQQGSMNMNINEQDYKFNSS